MLIPIPVVLLDAYFETVPCNCVLINNVQGAYLAARHLLELGHTYSEPTGTFDELTEQGVMNFQFLSDMVADGIADDALLDALYAPNAVKGPNYGLR